MTIESVTTHRLRLPLHTPFATALRRFTHIESVLVEVRDRDGCYGLGEAAQAWNATGDSLAGAEDCIRTQLAPRIVGRNPGDLYALCRTVAAAVVGNTSAKCAVDVALHDLLARRMGVPLHHFLGGTGTSVRTDVSLAAGDVGQLAEAATARVDEGFTVLKIKVGTDAASDLARIGAVRAAAGPHVTIRLDANQGWTPREAVGVIRAAEDAGYGVELVEQPVPRHNLTGMAWVRNRVDTPILADEAVHDLHDLLTILRHDAADMINVKLAKCGGLSPARTLIDLATAQGVPVLIGCMMESPVGIGAAAGLAAVVDPPVTPDLDGAWWLAPAAGVRRGIRYVGDRIVLPRGPGLDTDGPVPAGRVPTAPVPAGRVPTGPASG